LTLEVTRALSKTHITPEWKQTIAEANRFAGIISDDNDSDDGNGNDSLGGNDTAASTAGDEQQPGGRLQHEMNRLAPHNNPARELLEEELLDGCDKLLVLW
jgi:hypothetical protein